MYSETSSKIISDSIKDVSELAKQGSKEFSDTVKASWILSISIFSKEQI
jgi:hypothetical protein